MPKNSSAARREQARSRAKTKGISYTAALRQLSADRTDDGQVPPDTDLNAILGRWHAANNAAAAVDDPDTVADPHTVAHAMDARASAFQELGRLLRKRAAAGPVTLEPEGLEVLALACRRAGVLDELDAALQRVQWCIPTITPAAEVAKLRLLRCSACGQYWRPDNTAYCVQCPRIYHGPTPRDWAEAEELRPHRILLTAADFEPCDDDPGDEE